ncbi:hypothetical protein KC360_g3532 [Hortaea werneckii]|nr:hypothetical protein KC325_g697 [Hortaea werneckii]KAI7001156.1 hypothetical protein KC359_g892 [Hortaea werneckii]KAI7147243.1 hypothetical protein KC344_g3015 [Hortaea werneckii]KAI7175728.1 hypothetical protein KC360_g3532 [Hortaea werneckii]
MSEGALEKRKHDRPCRAGSVQSEGLSITRDPQEDVFATPISLGVSDDHSTTAMDQAPNKTADYIDTKPPDMHDNGHQRDISYSDWREQLPSHPAFSLEIERMEQGALKTVMGLHSILEDHAIDSKNLQDLIESAASAVQEFALPKKIVGLLGDTGTGKSSTINSLTSIPGLAVAVAAGESCTKVIVLFMHELPFQSSAFAAEVCYSDLETCRNLLEEQLKNYFRYTYEYDQDWNDSQQMEYDNACQTAFKIFRSLFCDKPEFESPRAGREFLDEAYSHNDNTALSVMEEWCRSLPADRMTEDGANLRFEAENVDDLNADLSPYISEHLDFEVPALCHLVNRVTIGARGSRILQYITLADLPGTSDVDQVRAAIAHAFLQKCDSLLVFEPMARCVDHPSAERNIATNADLFGPNMALVVTRSDDNVDDALAQNMCKKGQSVGDYFSFGTQIKQLDGQLMHTRLEIEKRVAVKKQKTVDSPFAESTLEELLKQQWELSEERRQHKNKQFETLVDARNSHTSRLLQRNKQRFMPLDVHLKVHCVSNSHYSAHLFDKEPDGPLLGVNATGIPALRAWLLQIVAPSLLLEIEERTGKCCAFVHGVAMWARSTPQTRKAGTMEVAQAPEISWSGTTENTLRSIEKAGDTTLFAPLQTRLGATVKAALGYHETLLSTWHPSTLRAFFLKGGKHSTKRQPLPTCWNEKFIDLQAKEVLHPNWDKMKREVHEQLEMMVTKLVEELYEVPKELDKTKFLMAAQSENVMGIITQYIGRIRRAYAVRLEKYDKELGSIKQNALFDEPRSYFRQAMRPMYENCSNMRGAGSVRRMMEEMEYHLSGKARRKSPFTAMNDSLRSNLSRASNRAVHKLQSDVAEILRQLAQRFDAALALEHETAEEKATRQAIMPALATALPDMDRIDTALKTLKASKRESKV